MAPKHGLKPPKGSHLKRAKTSAKAASRSVTPADTAKVSFKVLYPDVDAEDKSKLDEELCARAEWQASPFVAKHTEAELGEGESELDQWYTVVPSAEWDSMKKYNNFIIQGEMYKNNHFVYVRSTETPQHDRDKDLEENFKDFWVARILQVRALNAQHVYALVAWMYWADELPPPKTRSPDQISTRGGKRTYHGSHELIASNYMEVLDVLSFAGKADVMHWEEEDDSIHSKIYWRQTFCRETQELSKVRTHCICNGHFNPEISMYICDNPECKLWLHKACLVDDILTRTYVSTINGGKSTKETNGDTQMNGKAKGKTKPKPPYDGKLSGKIEDDSPPMIVIKDLRAGHVRQWRERIECPKCETELQ